MPQRVDFGPYLQTVALNWSAHKMLVPCKRHSNVTKAYFKSGKINPIALAILSDNLIDNMSVTVVIATELKQFQINSLQLRRSYLHFGFCTNAIQIIIFISILIRSMYFPSEFPNKSAPVALSHIKTSYF